MSSSSSSITPTTRSRTLLFLSYRDSRGPTSASRKRAQSSRNNYYDSTESGQGEEDERLLIGSANGEHVALDVDRDALPPPWVDVSDRVDELLAGIQTKIAQLDKLHAKHVLPGFSDRTAEARDIDALASSITRDFRAAHSQLTKITLPENQAPLQSPKHEFPPKRQPPSKAAVGAQQALAAKTQELSATFRKKQRVYMEKLQGHAVKNQDLLIASGTLSSRGTAGLSAADEDMSAASHTRMESLSATTVDPTLIERTRDLEHLAESITSLAALFRDLGSLVIDQGTLLDSVAYNIDQTEVHTSEASEELKVARTYQNRAGRRWCMFLLVLCIIGAALVLATKPRSSSAPPPLPSSTA